MAQDKAWEALPEIEKLRRTLRGRQIQLSKGPLNGSTGAARKSLAKFIDAGGELEEFADIAEAVQWSAPETSKADPAPPQAIGKPLEIPAHLQHLDHPTVRFLALREAAEPDQATFLICGDCPALVGFGESGELELVPLKATDKDGKEASWLPEDKSMRHLGSNLYEPHPRDGWREGTASCLDWIKAKSCNPRAKTKGSFYLTSVTDFDGETLRTTMGKATAKGLPELYLEWDDISKEEQLERLAWLKGLGFSLTVVESGGKSVHGHLHLDRMETFGDAFPVMKLLSALAGSDPGLVTKARRMRLAGALRPVDKRVRGGAVKTEQRLLETATHSYDLAEVRRVLEAEAKHRGWLVDHLETRWSEYREAKSALPVGWDSPEKAWTMPGEMAIAWSHNRRGRGSDGEFDPPVEWRRDETDLGWKIRKAEERLFEEHGLAGAFEFVASEGILLQKQERRGWLDFAFAFADHADGAVGQSPFSQVRASGVYSGNSLKLFAESKTFYCWASQRKGALGEWAAHWCPYEIARPSSPTPDEQVLLGLWLWELSGLDRAEFEEDGNAEDDLDKELRAANLERFENARKDRLELREVLPSSVADLLSIRAKAFPVSELAMLPPFMAASASILGTRYRTKVKKGHSEPSVFWLGTVGEASSLKTPVAEQVLAPLRVWDANAYKVEQERRAAQAALPREEQEQIPAARQRIASDATFEALARALSNPSTLGMVVHNDELAGWIGAMDRYRNNSSDRAQWLSLWSGGGIDVLRISRERQVVEKTAVSIFGTIQPDKLSELLDPEQAGTRGGDGFWARILWIKPPYLFPAANQDESDITPELTRIYGALDQISGEIEVELSEEAWKVYAQAADAFSREAEQCGGTRSPYLGKLRGYMVRFAGWLHAVEYAARISEPGVGGIMNMIPTEISAETMGRAVRMANYFLSSFDALAPQVGMSDIPAPVAKVLQLGEEQEKVSARDLIRRRWVADTKQAKQLLSSLVNDYGRGRLLPAPRKDQVWWTAS